MVHDLLLTCNACASKLVENKDAKKNTFHDMSDKEVNWATKILMHIKNNRSCMSINLGERSLESRDMNSLKIVHPCSEEIRDCVVEK